MRHGKLTRDQAIAEVGIEAVERVDAVNCEFTNRVQTDGDEAVEFFAMVNTTDRFGEDARLVAFYYQMPDDLEAAGDDLSNCNWAVSGYEVR